jgi:ELWxxDGT repeat protein
VEPYISDGTASGTRLLQDLAILPGSTNPHSIVDVGGKAFFCADVAGVGQSVCRSDGTASGTAGVLRWISRGGNSVAPVEFQGKYCFAACTEYDTAEQLWCSDGTDGGTQPLMESTTSTLYWSIKELQASGNRLFFTRGDYSVHSLWVTDGTSGGTVPIANAPKGSPNNRLRFCAADGKGLLYFAGPDGDRAQRLWRSDGTEAGTYALDCFTSTIVCTPGLWLDDMLYLVCQEPDGFYLWKSDGTTSGTERVAWLPIYIYDPLISPMQWEPTNDGRFFFVSNKLHISDGTASGTSSIFMHQDLSDLTFYRDRLYFLHEGALWSSDGRMHGTAAVAGVSPGAGARMVCVNDHLLISGGDANGQELWQSDGTAAGTIRWDLRPGLKGSAPQGLTRVGRRVFFSANDGVNGRELWSVEPVQSARVGGWSLYQ